MNRVAIILHGPTCVGKSSVAKSLSELISGSAFINLDDGWNDTECRGGTSGSSRYADLNGRPEEVLIIELALGEPQDLTPGATRQASLWVDILRNDGRIVFAFLLWAQWKDAISRMEQRAKKCDPREKLFWLAWWTASYAWYEHGYELTTFPAVDGLVEERIVTTDQAVDQVAKMIIKKVGIELKGGD
jgi:hypothetical protein